MVFVLLGARGPGRRFNDKWGLFINAIWATKRKVFGMKEFEVEKLQNEIEKTKTRLTIFLAGPSIQPGVEPADDLFANKARYKLFEYIKKGGDFCTLGEHRDLIEIGAEHFGKIANLALTEIAHVTNNGDGVIILPSSPGSFCELGMFANSDNISSKMLILMDKKYEEEPGYPYLGPTVMARFYGAQFKYIDYEDHDATWAIVTEFLEERRIRKLANKYRVPG
jgi:hypothetical protein